MLRRSLAIIVLSLLTGCLASRAPAPPATAPAEGQAAFAAIERTIAQLDADPSTDWTRVNITALHDHLVDMDALMLRANVTQEIVPDGLAMTITSTDATVGAIQRMVPEHQRMGLTDVPAWRSSVEPLPNGSRLVVTSSLPNEVARIRGLGFYGIMATGAHHDAHHLLLARGDLSMAHDMGR